LSARKLLINRLEGTLRKNLFVLAVLSAAFGDASAQSSVTVFGTLDVGVRHVKNGAGALYSVSSHGSSTSKIGFRGVEDLGDGLKAAFWLESQADPDVGTAGGSNGTASAFWNRRSTVSLLGKFGEVRLGRDYVPTFSTIADFDPLNTNGVGNALNLINQDNLGSGVVTQTRANNAVSYFLPAEIGGFYGNVMVAPGEGLPGQKYIGGRAGYGAGALKLQAGAGRTSTATADTPKFKQTNFAASYDFGVARLMGFVNVNKYDTKKATVYLIGTIVPVGLGEIRAAYLSRDSSGGGTDANDAKQLTIGYLHNLSKRTALYGNAGRLKNSGAANYVQAGGPPIGSLTGFASTGVEVGLRHHF
jgi:predicted porin